MGLTKEEKKSRKEVQRLAKKEAAEALRRQVKFDQLEREIASHDMWRNEIEKNWQDAILRFKEPVYRQRIEVMWHTLDHAYDKKDGLRDHIMHLTSVANSQYQRTITYFCEIVANILVTFLSDLEQMCKRNEVKIAEVLKQGQIEVAYLLKYKRRAETHMHLLLYTSHELADAKTWNSKGEYMVRKDEDKSTYLEILDNLKYILEGNYSTTWEEYKNTLKGYIISTAENQKQLQALRKKEQMMTDIITAQAKKLITSEMVIRRLRIELLAYESGEKQAGFRDRRTRHRDACIRLKMCMTQGVKTDIKQLNKLIQVSDEVIEWFEAATKKCEKIHRLATLCRKFETRREKVMPLGLDIPHESIKMNARSHVSDDHLISDVLSTTCGLTRLWQRISKAELTKRALIREKIKLERENAILESELAKKNDENLLPNTTKCQCNQRTSKKSFAGPYAVDGNAEIGKFLRY